MKKPNKLIQFGLEKLYFILSLLTKNVRLSFLIKLKIAVGIALISANSSNAQTVEFPNKTNSSDTLNLDVELEEDMTTLCYDVVVVYNKSKEPKFIGGQKALNRFVQDNVQYPKEALKNNIEGDVAINLMIDEDGNITDANILKAIGFGLDEEALRLVKIMPKMEPGKINHKKSTMNKTVVFHFELPDK
jgi:TonB family protein